ncbi:MULTISPECIES: LLM class flavin-dependent oxidoreductase [Rhizobium/Agrobacterium group]|nr:MULTISPECIES: LLM class flavin-dependent oxidoreductase [Rhizobium/Agrobacterium group]
MMHLALYLEGGTHLGGWRLPESATNGSTDWPLYRRIAKRAEAAKLDMIFMADKLSIDDSYGGSFVETVQYRLVNQPEPITLMSALAAVTDRIGLGGTISSSFANPYSVARQFANVDHISGGRAAWNLVTSTSNSEARNFGHDIHLDHETRYRRAAEFIDVVTRLWDSWEDGANLLDRERGVVADPSKFHYLDHQGEFFRTRGPINIPRPPQGHPVLIQAGVSDRFQDIAARHAEVVFVVHPQLERAQSFYRSFKARVREFGRSENAVKVLPGIAPIVGRTRQEALDKQEELRNLILPKAGLIFMSGAMNVDLSEFPLDAPFPDITDRITGSVGRFTYVVKYARENGMTVGEVGKWYAGSLSFFIPVGSPVEVADQLEYWYRNDACDGFVILPPFIRADGDLFLEEVVPILQERGLFRREYPGTTLRNTLGLPHPRNQFSVPSD